MSLIKWRRGGIAPLVGSLKASAVRLPPFVPGRGSGSNWPLPPLNDANAPVFISDNALPALVGVYEEYVDRYIENHDFDRPARRWLHENVPAEGGVLEYVFPILYGSASAFAAEVQLIRLVWLIQRCPGLTPFTSSTEMLVNTTVGKIGIEGDRALYRFNPEGVPLRHGVLISSALSVGHVRVFSKGLNKMYKALDDEGKTTLTLLSTRVRAKPLLRMFYDDGRVTGGFLSSMHRINDKMFSIESALLRSENPAETLRSMLVPEYLSPQEFRTLLKVPWKKEHRARIDAEYLLRKMPLVQKLLEDA